MILAGLRPRSRALRKKSMAVFRFGKGRGKTPRPRKEDVPAPGAVGSGLAPGAARQRRVHGGPDAAGAKIAGCGLQRLSMTRLDLLKVRGRLA